MENVDIAIDGTLTTKDSESWSYIMKNVMQKGDTLTVIPNESYYHIYMNAIIWLESFNTATVWLRC